MIKAHQPKRNADASAKRVSPHFRLSVEQIKAKWLVGDYTAQGYLFDLIESSRKDGWHFAIDDYEYFHLCTWDGKEKREQKRHLGSAKDLRYLQAKEAIWRRDRLEAIDGAIERLRKGKP
jgi:hypothetical protein